MTIKLDQARAPDSLRIYAIGDVHGHLALLERLWAKIDNELAQHSDDYRIIFLGDYVDRGPDSAGCVDFLIKLSKHNPNVVCLKGNHEAKLEAFLRDPVRIADSFFGFGGLECTRSYGVDIHTIPTSSEDIHRISIELEKRIPASHHAFFAELPVRIDFGDYLFVHAGVRPGVDLDQQDEQDLITIRGEFISHPGLFDKVIVHGHTPAYPMEILPHRINVDTHAYATGVLSCLVLEGPHFRVLEA